jgi:glycosyltransferase involved in cell wall biosynthesis
LKRAIVSVTNDLSTDQRVAKTCAVLKLLDYEVLLIGRKLHDSIPISRNYPVKRFKLFFNTSFLFYAEYNIRLFFFLLFTKKSILVANDLDTLLANFWISKLQRKPLVYDSHEAFTEVPELIDRPFVKKFWSRIESGIVPKLKHMIVVSESIATFYHKKYGIVPKVIRNLPLASESSLGKWPFKNENKKVILYQGALNIGRGIELMIDTISLLEDYVFVIAGNGDIVEQLKERVSEKKRNHQVFFLGQIPPKELKRLTPLADIGISLEEDMGINYRYALPNKLFDYIHAQVPVIVSNLPEMSRIVTEYEVGKVLNIRTPEELADLILSTDKKKYLNSLQKAKKELQWSSEREKLIPIFKHL